eukprot:741851-Prymnesium_polylepis.1
MVVTLFRLTFSSPDGGRGRTAGPEVGGPLVSTLNGPSQRHSSLKVHVAPCFTFRVKVSKGDRCGGRRIIRAIGAHDARTQSGERLRNHTRDDELSMSMGSDEEAVQGVCAGLDSQRAVSRLDALTRSQ